MKLNFSYASSEVFCKQIGLDWFPEMLTGPDAAASAAGLTQEQVDAMMREHLWNVRCLFNPAGYKLWGRIRIALFFLSGVSALPKELGSKK